MKWEMYGELEIQPGRDWGRLRILGSTLSVLVKDKKLVSGAGRFFGSIRIGRKGLFCVVEGKRNEE